MRERLLSILARKSLKAKGLEQLSGINRELWCALRCGLRRVNEDDITVRVEIAPEYPLWMATGKIVPDAGQSGPEYNDANENLPKPNAG
ncbi:DNA-binding protein [Pseudomonas sp. 21]|nr:DNA-binding protein [Pseudomonas sp. 21]